MRSGAAGKQPPRTEQSNAWQCSDAKPVLQITQVHHAAAPSIAHAGLLAAVPSCAVQEFSVQHTSPAKLVRAHMRSMWQGIQPVPAVHCSLQSKQQL